MPKILTNGIDHYFKHQSRVIQGLGNATIHPIGSIDVNLNIGNIQLIKHNFWVTEEPRSYGIIGLDFLKANNLIISAHTSELLEAMSDHTATLYKLMIFPNH